jgi:hypothetical protein
MSPQDHETTAVCPRCRVADCRRAFDELCAKEFGDRDYAAVHLLTVDAYSLQHGEERSARSNAYHLVRLTAALEFAADSGTGSPEPRGWRERIERGIALPDSAIPADPGEMTVTHPTGAAGPAEHGERVREWARAVWETWGGYHDWARAELERL